VDETAASLGRDASRYRRLFGPIVRHENAIVDAVLSSMRAVPSHPLVPAGFALSGVRSASAIAGHFSTAEARS